MPTRRKNPTKHTRSVVTVVYTDGRRVSTTYVVKGAFSAAVKTKLRAKLKRHKGVKSVLFGGDIGQVRSVRRSNTGWWSAGQKWLEMRTHKDYLKQRNAWKRSGRSASTFRFTPEDWHRDAVAALGRNDERAFKAIKLAAVDRAGESAHSWERRPNKRRKNSGGKVEIELYNASRLDRGGYTKHGTYYGNVRGTKIYEYAIEYASGGRPQYSAVRAHDKKAAKAQLLRMFPGAIIST